VLFKLESKHLLSRLRVEFGLAKLKHLGLGKEELLADHDVEGV